MAAENTPSAKSGDVIASRIANGADLMKARCSADVLNLRFTRESLCRSLK